MEATKKAPVCVVCADCDNGPNHAATVAVIEAAGPRMRDMQRDPKRRKEEFERVSALLAAAVDADSLRAADSEVYWIRAGFTESEKSKLLALLTRRADELGVEA